MGNAIFLTEEGINEDTWFEPYKTISPTENWAKEKFTPAQHEQIQKGEQASDL
jgi:hypothetical protein